MKFHRFGWVMIAALCLAQLTGCAELLGQFTAAVAEETPTPTPGLPEEWQSTPSASMRRVASLACTLASWYTPRIVDPQGDLMAWSPDGRRLAFLRRQDQNAWYVGDLVIASGDDFQTLDEPAMAVNAFGDLTWSPDGSALAFVALRSDDLTYTVQVASPEKIIPLDLFPDEAVHTNPWSSPKGIARWLSNQSLRICMQCGTGCSETAEVELASGYRAGSAAPVTAASGSLNLATCLTPERGAPPAGDDLFPDDTLVNWSPDGNRATYIDPDGKLWVYQPGQRTAFPRETDSAVQETKWSPDSAYLAIRTEDQVFIDQIECQ